MALPSSTRPPSWVDEAAPLPVRNDYGARYGGYDTGGYYAGATGGYAQQYAAAHPLAPAAAHYYVLFRVVLRRWRGLTFDFRAGAAAGL